MILELLKESNELIKVIFVCILLNAAVKGLHGFDIVSTCFVCLGCELLNSRLIDECLERSL